MRKIRILHSELTNEIGGIETFLKNASEHIDRDRFQFEFITSVTSPVFEDEFIRLGGIIRKIHSFSSPIQYRNDLNDIMADDYDIIHFHKNSLANINPIIQADKHKKCYIIHSHNTSNTKNRVLDFLHYCNRAYIAKKNCEHLACSQMAGKWMFGENGEYTIIRNGINTKRFQYNSQIADEVRIELGLGNSFVVGHVGRYTKQKNHRFIIEVFSELLKIIPNAKLLLIGDGDLYKDISQQIENFGIASSVKQLGGRKDVDRIIQSFDVFLFPSVYEGLGIAGIEAQAAGIPVIASNNIPDEFCINSNVKRISLNEPPKYWAKQITSYGKTGRCYVNAHEFPFSIEYTINQIEKIYKKMTNN